MSGVDTASVQFLIAATAFLRQPCARDMPSIDTFSSRIIPAAGGDDGYSFHGGLACQPPRPTLLSTGGVHDRVIKSARADGSSRDAGT